MTTEIIDALLWRARAALRVDGLAMSAGHGLADPLYRPPRLPYASVLGPLSYAVEPERDLPRQHVLSVRTPGYLAGAELPDDVVLPPPGEVTLVFDADVRVTLVLDHGADTGQNLTLARGRALAQRMQAAFDTVRATGFAAIDGTPVEDPGRLAELERTAIRWDEPRRRIVISSGRHGPIGSGAPVPSSVRLDPEAAVDHAAALGLADGDPLASPPVPGAVTPQGRIIRHQVPSPIAMSFDTRVDLWAGSQRHLAAFVEAWARVTPTRCQLLLRPALLAASVTAGSDEVRLQTTGEPPTRWTLLQLEPGDTFSDRRTGESPRLSGGTAAQQDGLRLPQAGSATTRLLRPVAIPDPLAPAHPAPTGWALSLNVRLVGDPSVHPVGSRMLLAELDHDGRSALKVDLVWANNGGLRLQLEATAQTADGTPLEGAQLTIPLDAPVGEEPGIEVHALVDALQGQVAVFADGDAGVGPVSGPLGVPGGENMLLRIGAAGAPMECIIGHLQVLGRPLGPVDHRHRASVATSDQWRPGDPLTLTRTDDGFTPKGDAFVATVVGVTDSSLQLDRPVVGNWPRHDTLVGTRVVFSQQTQVRRRDDLASNIARMSLNHTVSGFVDPHDAGTSARLVEAIDLQVRDRGRVVVDDRDGALPPSTRRQDGAPTVQGRIVPARVLTVQKPDGEEPPRSDEIDRAPEVSPAEQPTQQP